MIFIVEIYYLTFFTYAYITDLGLCQPANVKTTVAPEVLRGKEYTQASDIYGFGILILHSPFFKKNQLLRNIF
ncbi:hypothetical protein RclHR1_11100004 [Rhizophagus clarus]|uniref:Kinase-like domain-containing protein n=1 Tax=Rhizophagus clarus TaxID=94130 RepID=A0A2Z6QWD6_9GLOM|nr:hypothetical protein RclHR1_11100004 [Rhizophagus clarus]GET04153.1 kinase-like domain-containing protein [Rhizophagus clarus]